jgi:hypothetical protein
LALNNHPEIRVLSLDVCQFLRDERQLLVFLPKGRRYVIDRGRWISAPPLMAACETCPPPPWLLGRPSGEFRRQIAKVLLQERVNIFRRELDNLLQRSQGLSREEPRDNSCSPFFETQAGLHGSAR